MVNDSQLLGECFFFVMWRRLVLRTQISVSLRAKVSKSRILRRSMLQMCCSASRDAVDELLYADDDQVPPARLSGE